MKKRRRHPGKWWFYEERQQTAPGWCRPYRGYFVIILWVEGQYWWSLLDGIPKGDGHGRFEEPILEDNVVKTGRLLASDAAAVKAFVLDAVDAYLEEPATLVIGFGLDEDEKEDQA